MAKIAADLEMDLDTFVNTIGYYINNPGVEPAFLVVSDENLRKLGVEPPSQEALEANVRATVEAIQAGQAPSGFDDARKKSVDLQGGGGSKSSDYPSSGDTSKKGNNPVKP